MVAIVAIANADQKLNVSFTLPETEKPTTPMISTARPAGPFGAGDPGGSQALALEPAQGGFVELVFPEPGDYPFVTHRMSDAEKGARGVFRVQ